MKIVYLTFSIIPSAMADSVQSMRMCHGLVQAGHEVIMLAPDRPLSGPAPADLFGFYGLPPSFRIEKVPWKHFMERAYFHGFPVARRCRRLQPDLVYSRTVWEALWAAWLGLPVLFESHSPPGGRITAPLFHRFLKSRRLVRLAVISEALGRHFRDAHGVPAEKMVLARDAADLPPADLATPAGWPGRKGCVQAGYFGSLVEGRGPDMLAGLSRRHPDIDFHIGGGNIGQVAYWKERMPGPNLFFHGWLAPGVVPAYMSACDILLAPYKRRVFLGLQDYEITNWLSPMKLFEYMAAGKAILASDLPAIREFMGHERIALLCPPEDESAWSAALSRLAAEPALRSRLGAAARSEVAEKYTWKARAEKVLQGLK